MPYDGNGNYVRVHNWAADQANGLDINATEMDAEDNSIAAALSNAVTRDGQGKMGVDFLPNADNTLNLGSAAARWASVNGVPIPSGSNPWTVIPRTSAEILASVNPTNVGYTPGDLRRYGATAGGNISTALASACAQAQQVGGAAVYWSSGLGIACTINAGVTITTPIVVYGDGPQICSATCTDVTVFTVNVGGSGTTFRGFQLVGPGGSPTNPAILHTNANNCWGELLWISRFNCGIRYAQGINSSYLNTLRSCRIVLNTAINIDAQKNTNALLIDGTTFGAAPIGLKCVDSTSLTILGGDVEGCTTTAIDLDCTANIFMAAQIFGLHMEGNNSTGGDIRIGNNGAFTVFGVDIYAFFGPLGSNGAINAVTCTGLRVRGTMGTSVAFLKKTNLASEDIDLGNTFNNIPCYRARSYKAKLGDESAVTQRSAAFIDGNYQDSGTFNQYQVQPTSTSANGTYYSAIDLIELANVAGASAANAKLYARLMYGLNSKADSTKVGAAKFVGDVDALSGAWSFGSGSSGAIGNGGTITTANTANARIQPAGNVTGIIIQAGTQDGQKITVGNQSAFTVTFAAAGTSNVADGASSAIPANCGRSFTWLTSSALWFRDA